MTNTPKKTTVGIIAYCYASGVIKFGKKVPDGTLPIVQGKNTRIRRLVEVLSRHAYDGKTFLVPGIPEAECEKERLDALQAFTNRIQASLDKDAKLDEWNARNPKGTRVIVHSVVGGRACCVSGRTTTKARLSFGDPVVRVQHMGEMSFENMVIRVQHMGENTWVPLSSLTYPDGGAV